jgi:putative DNA primase/helicase
MNFETTLRLMGFHPNVVIDDGRWRRCKTDDKPGKKNGAYCLFADGHGLYKNWATDDKANVWHDGDATTAPRPIDMARVQAQKDRDRAYRVQAVRSAREFWSRATPLSLHHPYLKNKGLSPTGCFGLRQCDDLLVIPVMWGNSLISIQTIAADGAKRFWPGAPVKQGSFAIKRERAPLTVLCEGLATGLAVFQSVRSANVIVCFDAGNLLPVTEFIKPKGSVVFAADNDWATKIKIGTNPGIDKATNAAELIGAGVAYPEGIEGTDWADFLKEHGEGGAKRIERAILAKARYVMA